jgi:spore coat polysaccharide biosynthesis protein SpsF
MEYKTEQESFWAGEFGNEYSQRNNDEQLLISKTALFSRIFQIVGKVSSVIEFGSNIGLNLQSIAKLLPKTELSAIDINGYAKE